MKVIKGKKIEGLLPIDIQLFGAIGSTTKTYSQRLFGTYAPGTFPYNLDVHKTESCSTNLCMDPGYAYLTFNGISTTSGTTFTAAPGCNFQQSAHSESLGFPYEIHYTLTATQTNAIRALGPGTYYVFIDGEARGKVITITGQTTPSYSVTFSGNGGPNPSPSTYSIQSGSTVTAPSGPTRAGYTFDGWYENTAGTGTRWNPGAGIIITSARTFYAKWIANTYSVTYAPNGGTSASFNNAQYSISTSTQYRTIAAPYRLGYTTETVSITRTSSGGTEPSFTNTTYQNLSIPANSYGHITATARWLPKAISGTLKVSPAGSAYLNQKWWGENQPGAYDTSNPNAQNGEWTSTYPFGSWIGARSISITQGYRYNRVITTGGVTLSSSHTNATQFIGQVTGEAAFTMTYETLLNNINVRWIRNNGIVVANTINYGASVSAPTKTANSADGIFTYSWPVSSVSYTNSLAHGSVVNVTEAASRRDYILTKGSTPTGVSSFTVNRTSSPGGLATGALSNGVALKGGDILSVYGSAAVGYNSPTFSHTSVNVGSNVTITATAGGYERYYINIYPGFNSLPPIQVNYLYNPSGPTSINWNHPVRPGYYPGEFESNLSGNILHAGLGFGVNSLLFVKGSRGGGEMHYTWIPNQYSITLQAREGVKSATLNRNNYNITTGTFTPSVSSITYDTANGYGRNGYTSNISSITLGSTGDRTFWIEAERNVYTVTFNSYHGISNTEQHTHGTNLMSYNPPFTTALVGGGYTYSWPSRSTSLTSDVTYKEVRTMNQEYFDVNPVPADIGFSFNVYRSPDNSTWTLISNNVQDYYQQWGVINSIKVNSFNIPGGWRYSHTTYDNLPDNTGTSGTGATGTSNPNNAGARNVNIHLSGNNYSIVYNGKGGTGGSINGSSYTVSQSEKTFKVTDPTRPGYNFLGHSTATSTGAVGYNNTSKILTVPAYTISAPQYGDVYVNALWSDPIKYKLNIALDSTSVSAGTLLVTEYDVTSQYILTATGVSYKTGYGKTGYTLNPSYIDMGTTGDKTVTLSASINTYNVAFKYYNGTTQSTSVQPHFTNVRNMVPSAKTADTAQYSYAWPTSTMTTSLSSDVSYTETRTVRSYVITFKSYDGVVLKTETLAYGSTPTPPTGTADTNLYDYKWPSVTTVSGTKTYTELRDSKQYIVTYNNGGYGTFTGPTSYIASTAAQHITGVTFPTRSLHTPTFSTTGNVGAVTIDRTNQRLSLAASAYGDFSVNTAWTEVSSNFKFITSPSDIGINAVVRFNDSNAGNTVNSGSFPRSVFSTMSVNNVNYPMGWGHNSVTSSGLNTFSYNTTTRNGSGVSNTAIDPSVDRSITVTAKGNQYSLIMNAGSFTLGNSTVITPTNGTINATNYTVSKTAQTFAITNSSATGATLMGYSINSGNNANGYATYVNSTRILTIPGWTVDAKVHGNVRLDAVWSVSGTTYTWKYYNGATAKTETILYGGTSTAPTGTPTNTTNTFAWPQQVYTAGSTTTSQTITETSAYRKYTVTVSAGTGGTGGSSFEYTYSPSAQTKTITLPTRTNYNITGWTALLGEVGSTTITVSGTTLTIPAATAGNIIITPTWAGNTITITLNPNGGTKGSVDKITSVYATSLTAWSNAMKPTRLGHSFKGFYTAATGGTQVISASGSYVGLNNTTYTSNTTLYAQWEVLNYTVSIGTTANISTKFKVYINNVLDSTTTNGVSSYSKSIAFGSVIKVSDITIPSGYEWVSNSFSGITLSSNSSSILEGTLSAENAVSLTINTRGKTYNIVTKINDSASTNTITYQTSHLAQTINIDAGTKSNYEVQSLTVTRTGTDTGGTAPSQATIGSITIPANSHGDISVTPVWIGLEYTVIWRTIGSTDSKTDKIRYDGANTTSSTKPTTNTTATGLHTHSWPIDSLVPTGSAITNSTYTAATRTYVITEIQNARTYTVTLTKGTNSNIYSEGTNTVITQLTYVTTAARTLKFDIKSTKAGYSIANTTASITTSPTAGTVTLSHSTGTDVRTVTVSIPNGAYGNMTITVGAAAGISNTITKGTLPTGITNITLNPTTYTTKNGTTAVTVSYTMADGYTQPTGAVTVSGLLKDGSTLAAASITATGFTIPADGYGNITVTPATPGKTTYTITLTKGVGIETATITPTSFNVETASFTPSVTGVTYKAGYSSSTISPTLAQIPKGSVGNRTYTITGGGSDLAITLEPNGGTAGSVTSIPFVYGTSLTAWASGMKPIRTNWTFTGFWTAATGGTKRIDSDGTYVALTNTTYTNNATLYAQWTWNYEGVQYSITGVDASSNNSYLAKSSGSITTMITLKKNPWETWGTPTSSVGTIASIENNGDVQTFNLTIPALTTGNIAITKKVTATEYTISLSQKTNTTLSISNTKYTYSATAQSRTLSYASTAAGYNTPTTASVSSNPTVGVPTISGLNLTIPAGAYGNFTVTAATPTTISYSISLTRGAGITGGTITPTSYTVESANFTPSITNIQYATGYSDHSVTPALTQINKGSTGNKSYTITGVSVVYTITYNMTAGGTLPSGHPTSYTVTSDDITLPIPTLANYTFDGWYENSNFTGSILEVIPKGSTGNKTLYPKWMKTLTILHNNQGLKNRAVPNILGKNQVNATNYRLHTQNGVNLDFDTNTKNYRLHGTIGGSFAYTLAAQKPKLPYAIQIIKVNQTTWANTDVVFVVGSGGSAWQAQIGSTNDLGTNVVSTEGGSQPVQISIWSPNTLSGAIDFTFRLQIEDGSAVTTYEDPVLETVEYQQTVKGSAFVMPNTPSMDRAQFLCWSEERVAMNEHALIGKNLLTPDLTGAALQADGWYRLRTNIGLTVDYLPEKGYIRVNGTTTSTSFGKLFNLKEPITYSGNPYKVSTTRIHISGTGKADSIYASSPAKNLLAIDQYIKEGTEITSDISEILFSDHTIGTVFTNYIFALQMEYGDFATSFSRTRKGVFGETTIDWPYNPDGNKTIYASWEGNRYDIYVNDGKEDIMVDNYRYSKDEELDPIELGYDVVKSYSEKPNYDLKTIKSISVTGPGQYDANTGQLKVPRNSYGEIMFTSTMTEIRIELERVDGTYKPTKINGTAVKTVLDGKVLNSNQNPIVTTEMVKLDDLVTPMGGSIITINSTSTVESELKAAFEAIKVKVTYEGNQYDIPAKEFWKGRTVVIQNSAKTARFKYFIK